MQYRLIPILITFLVILLGFVNRVINANSIMKRREFTLAFRNSFISMANSFFETGRMQNNLYANVIHDVDAIQEELGNDGVIADYIDRLHGIQGRNYQLFVNVIPEIREAEGLRDDSIVMGRISQLIGFCDDALQRHIGNLDRELDSERKGFFNPFKCFGAGVKFIIELPFLILYWCGLVSTSTICATRGSYTFKIISSIVTFVGLISSIITIVIGWNEVTEIVVRVWRTL